MSDETHEIKAFLDASLQAQQAIISKSVTPTIIDLYSKHKATLLTEWRHLCFNRLPSIEKARTCGTLVAEVVFQGGLSRKLELRDLVKRVTELYYVAIDGLVSEKLMAEESGDETKPEQGWLGEREYKILLERWEKKMMVLREKREGQVYRSLAFFGALKEGLRIRMEALMVAREEARMKGIGGAECFA